MEKPSQEPLIEDLLKRLNAQAETIDELMRQNKQQQKQLDWFKRQLFGRKSEVRQDVSPHQQVFESFFPEASKKNRSAFHRYRQLSPTTQKKSF